VKKILLVSAMAALSTISFADEAITETTAPMAAQAKQFNVAVNPLALALGMISGEAQIGLTNELTVGPKASYWSLDLGGDAFTFYSIGAISQYSFGGTFQDGGYLKAQALYTGVSLETSNYSGVSCEASASLFNVGGLGGYQWFWGSGFNMNLGAGYSVAIGDMNADAECSDGSQKESESSSDDMTGTGGLALEWNLGFAF
jgi:hypothetical protein